jgi:hypothetical protein
LLGLGHAPSGVIPGGRCETETTFPHADILAGAKHDVVKDGNIQQFSGLDQLTGERDVL